MTPRRAAGGRSPTWYLPGTTPRGKSVTADWTFVDRSLIDGVTVKEARNVPTDYGHLTEAYRTDWNLDVGGVDQVFQSTFEPGRLSAWHAHERTTDRIFALGGTFLLVLYDNRPESPTMGRLNEFRISALRPTMVSIPPTVWHGVKNVGSDLATLLNIVDTAYDYELPDHVTVPADSPHVPFDIVGRRHHI